MWEQNKQRTAILKGMKAGDRHIRRREILPEGKSLRWDQNIWLGLAKMLDMPIRTKREEEQGVLVIERLAPHERPTYQEPVAAQSA